MREDLGTISRIEAHRRIIEARHDVKVRPMKEKILDWVLIIICGLCIGGVVGLYIIG